MTTTDTTTDLVRAARVRELAKTSASLEFSPWSMTDTLDETTGAPRRWALMESSRAHDWLTTHDSPTAAVRYNAWQEYADDWSIVALVDLDATEDAWQAGAAELPETDWPHVPEAGTDAGALDRIAALLDGVEWETSHLDDIAALVRNTGRTITDTPEGA